MTRRFIWAMLAYAVLAGLAGWTLDDAVVRVGDRTVELRVAVWILLGGLALKTMGEVGQRAIDTAFGDYSIASALRPRSGLARAMLGVTLAIKGDLQTALANIQRATEIEPG